MKNYTDLKRDGFTLVELIMIIVILGILATLAIPRFFDLRTQAELSVARHFEGALKEAASNYLATEALGGVNFTNPPGDHTTPFANSFNSFVGLARDNFGNNEFITINDSIRELLIEPDRQTVNVMVPDSFHITFNFRSGAVATYTYNPTNGAITANYQNF